MIFFEKHSTNTYTHIRMSTHIYERTYAHPVSMNTSEKLSQLDLEIHKVGHQERFAIDRDIVSH
jgi:hypothetical protein